MQHHRLSAVIASIAGMADDSDKNLKHNDEEQLQRLLDSMGQESAAAPRPPKKKSSKGSAGQESAAPRPEKKKKSNKGAVSKFRSEQQKKRRGSIDTGAAREPAPAPRKKKEKRRREAPQPQPRRPPPPLPSSFQSFGTAVTCPVVYPSFVRVDGVHKLTCSDI